MAYTDLHSLRPSCGAGVSTCALVSRTRNRWTEGISEFGSFNHRHAMQPNHYVYSALGERRHVPVQRLCKHDLRNKTRRTCLSVQAYTAAKRRSRRAINSKSKTTAIPRHFHHRHEPRTAPNAGSTGRTGPGRRSAGQGAPAARIPSGTHACWASGGRIAQLSPSVILSTAKGEPLRFATKLAGVVNARPWMAGRAPIA